LQAGGFITASIKTHNFHHQICAAVLVMKKDMTMDYRRILKRSWDITWNYRALWVFGFILALTTPGGGGSNGGGGGGGGGGSFTVPSAAAGPWALPFLQPFQDQQAMLPLIISLIIAGVLLGIMFTIARVVAETAAIRMVDRYEDTGVRVSVAEGFRLGWSRAALRIFLIDLLVTVAIIFTVFILMAIVLAPLLLWGTQNEVAGAFGSIITAVLSVPAILLFIVLVIAVLVLLQFSHRAIVLEGRGVFESIRRGWDVARVRLGEVIVLTLLLFAVGLVASMVVIPIALLLIFFGVAIGGLPALIAAWITGLFAQGAVPWMVAVVIGAPIFFLIVVVPLLFVNGLVKIFTSSSWTLAYRDLTAAEVLPA
jgi:hypothetical protein